jgi:hypothetical protein
MSNVPPPVFVASPVFIHLLHGRDDPDQDMTDWGFAGPLLGPFEAVHFTYREHIRCIEDAHKGTELELRFHEDLLVYAGKYYGDFEICGGQRLDYKNLVPEFFASLVSLRVWPRASSEAVRASAPNGRLGP